MTPNSPSFIFKVLVCAGPSTSGSGATSFESSMQQQSTANKVTMQHAMPMQPPNTNKVTSTPKPKPSVQLFPR